MSTTAASLLAFFEDLRSEGVAVGTSEILDAFAALDEVSWTDQRDFRESLAATIAKSQEDRRVFELLFDRFFFRAAESEALERGIEDERFEGSGDRIDLDELREAIRRAIIEGNDGEMRDLARLAMTAFGRQGERSGVIGVDVQRIRRALDLQSRSRRDDGDEQALDPENVRQFERYLRRELERATIERTGKLPPSRPLAELDRTLPTSPAQDLTAVHRA
ncbi:MAG: CoxE, partial [Solirubrobacterales bacterium]